MNSKKPKIGVAVVQWNHSDLTLQLLNSFFSSATEYKIVVCDNGSEIEHKNALQTYIEKQFSKNSNQEDWQLQLLFNQNNSGFARAMNACIECLLDSDCEWIWLINNDVSISDSSLKKLEHSLSNQKAGIYGMTLLEKTIGKVHGGYLFNYFTTRFQAIRTSKEFRQSADTNKYISGASMIVHQSVFKSTGLLNERHFLYFEELDFTLRALQQGFKQHCLAEIEATHLGAASSMNPETKKKIIYHETWSTLNFYKTHRPWLFFFILLARTPIRIFTLLLSSRKHLISSVIHATKDFLLNKNKDWHDIEVTNKLYYSR